MKSVAEYVFNVSQSYLDTSGSYDSNYLMMGNLLRQYSDGETTYVSPLKNQILNMVSASGRDAQFIDVIKPHWSDHIYWLFTTEPAVVSNGLRIEKYIYDSNSETINYTPNFSSITYQTSLAGGTINFYHPKFFYKTMSTGSVTKVGNDFFIEAIKDYTQYPIYDYSSIIFDTPVETIGTITSLSQSSTGLTLQISNFISFTGSVNYYIDNVSATSPVNSSDFVNRGVLYINSVNRPNGSAPSNIINANSNDVDAPSYRMLYTELPISCSIPISNSAIISSQPHNFSINEKICFDPSFGGTLPTGIATNIIYYVVSQNYGPSQFSVSTTLGGSLVNTTGTTTGIIGVISLDKKPQYPVGISYEQYDQSDITAPIYINILNNYDALGAANSRYNIYKYNLNKRVSSEYIQNSTIIYHGVITSSYVLNTDIETIPGTLLIGRSGTKAMISMSTDAFSCEESMFVRSTSANRVYRISSENIYSGSTKLLSDYSLENAPGGNLTYFNPLNFDNIDVDPYTNIMGISCTSTPYGMYIDQYDPTEKNTYQYYIGQNTNRIYKHGTSTSASVGIINPGVHSHIAFNSGIMFTNTVSTNADLNCLTVIPIGAHSKYAEKTGQHVITPKVQTPNCKLYNRIYVLRNSYDTSYELGGVPGKHKLYYRIDGIDDNSGNWVLVPKDGYIEPVKSEEIQFKIEFSMMDIQCIPAKIYSIACSYETYDTVHQYEISVDYSDAENKTFVWKQQHSWGSNIPDLRLVIYNTDQNNIILDDTIGASAYGVWQYSTDTISWNTWDNTQDTVGNYIRYIAHQLPQNINSKIILTQ